MSGLDFLVSRIEFASPGADPLSERPANAVERVHQHKLIPHAPGTECVAVCNPFQQLLAARQMKQGAAPEPSQIPMGVAGPVAAHEPVRADVNDLVSPLTQEIECRGDKRFVTVMVQLSHGPDVPMKTLARTRNQFFNESGRN